MNKRLVMASLGNVMLVEALLLLFPMLTGLYYHEGTTQLFAFIETIILLLIIGSLLSILKPKHARYTVRDGFAITALTWFVVSFFGGLPFVFAGEIPSVINATFEMASGFTTTGSSILTDVEALSQSMLFWRSFSHLIGGLGVLVFIFAFTPELGEGSVNIMKAEVPGPEFGKLSAKNKSSAKILYGMYFVLTAILIAALIFTGMKPFDAIIHGFGTAGTGGFSNKATSVQALHNPGAEYILSIGMIVFGMNFNLFYYLLKKEWRVVYKNEELRLFLIIIALAIGGIMLNLAPQYSSIEKLFRDALFQVTTIISTTGFGTVDFALWPLFSQCILLLIMFVGGMAGSTAGGLKVSRISIFLKTSLSQIRKSINPRRVVPVTMDRHWVNNTHVSQVFIYFGIYALVFTVALFVVALDQNDFMTAFSAVAATFNNIGPGLGNVGPTSSFASLQPFTKIILTITMIAGRLEIYPVLALLLPSLWKRKS